MEEADAQRAPADLLLQAQLGRELEHPVVLERDRVVVAVDLDAADARRAREAADAVAGLVDRHGDAALGERVAGGEPEQPAADDPHAVVVQGVDRRRHARSLACRIMSRA